jgi:hypothetical protein
MGDIAMSIRKVLPSALFKEKSYHVIYIFVVYMSIHIAYAFVLCNMTFLLDNSIFVSISR